MFKNMNKVKLLKEFFINPSRKSSLRDLARRTHLSVATVSKVCLELSENKIVKTERVGRSLLVFAYVVSAEYRFLKRLFNIYVLKDLVFRLSEENPSAVVLFGSYSRGEDDEESDIDLAVIGAEFKVDVNKFESVLGRRLHFLFFASEKDISSELRVSLNNGVVLLGGLL